MPYDLSKSDYDILAYINQYDHVSKEQIIGHFNGKIYAIEYRLNNLSSPACAEGVKSLLPHSNYIKEEMKINDSRDRFTPFLVSKNMYHITDAGRKALDEYRTKNKAERLQFWLPIIVSNLIALAALIKSFMPEIIEVWKLIMR